MLTTATLKKSISYRVYSYVITAVIAYVFTRNIWASLSIGFLDSIVKIFSYQFFEELWNKLVGIKSKPCVIWLTGYSGAGKTTIANDLMRKFKSKGIYPVLLDGDEIRNVVRQFGFDETSRRNHNLNVGYIAALFEKQGNIVIVSLISPYHDTRDEIRNLCKHFIEVHVATDLQVCIERDTKGLYKKAISGEVKNFTGVSAPYYPPDKPEVYIDTVNQDVSASSDLILAYYKKRV